MNFEASLEVMREIMTGRKERVAKGVISVYKTTPMFFLLPKSTTILKRKKETTPQEGEWLVRLFSKAIPSVILLPIGRLLYLCEDEQQHLVVETEERKSMEAE